MNIYDETRALVVSAGCYGVDESLFHFASSRGLLTADHTNTGSLENWGTFVPTLALEDVQKSFLQRAKERFSEMSINFEARRRRKKELKKKGAISDANVVYPKLKPSESSEYFETGGYLVRILNTAVSGFNPSKFKTEAAAEQYKEDLLRVITQPAGVLDGIGQIPNKEIPKGFSFDIKKAVLAIAGRDIGDSVNGWELTTLNTARNKINQEADRISYLAKRMVGLINSISFDEFDEFPGLVHAVDAAQSAMRVALAGYKEWMEALGRVDLL